MSSLDNAQYIALAYLVAFIILCVLIFDSLWAAKRADAAWARVQQVAPEEGTATKTAEDKNTQQDTSA